MTSHDYTTKIALIDEQIAAADTSLLALTRRHDELAFDAVTGSETAKSELAGLAGRRTEIEGSRATLVAAREEAERRRKLVFAQEKHDVEVRQAARAVVKVRRLIECAASFDASLANAAELGAAVQASVAEVRATGLIDGDILENLALHRLMRPALEFAGLAPVGLFPGFTGGGQCVAEAARQFARLGPATLRLAAEAEAEPDAAAA